MGRLFFFDGTTPHWSDNLKGWRCSLIAFQHTCYASLPSSGPTTLQDFDFRPAPCRVVQTHDAPRCSSRQCRAWALCLKAAFAAWPLVCTGCRARLSCVAAKGRVGPTPWRKTRKTNSDAISGTATFRCSSSKHAAPTVDRGATSSETDIRTMARGRRTTCTLESKESSNKKDMYRFGQRVPSQKQPATFEKHATQISKSSPKGEKSPQECCETTQLHLRSPLRDDREDVERHTGAEVPNLWLNDMVASPVGRVPKMLPNRTASTEECSRTSALLARPQERDSTLQLEPSIWASAFAASFQRMLTVRERMALPSRSNRMHCPVGVATTNTVGTVD